MAGAHYMLVDDFRPFAMAKVVSWPSETLATLFDFGREGAWLYRPFPDVMEAVLSRAFGSHSGAWHLLMICVRLATIGTAFAIARSAAPWPPSIAAAAYVAFVPAMPELQLIRAESWLMPALGFTLLGWLQSVRRPKTTALAFILATMAKEVVAPLLGLLFLLLVPFYWRKNRGLLAAMAIALLNQVVHFVLVFTDPYAKSAGLVATAMKNAVWVTKSLLFVTTTFPLFSLFLAAWFVLGIVRLLRLRTMTAAGIALLFVAAVGMALIAPYQALRYIYPAALFAVPILALGIEQLRDLAGARVATTFAAISIAVLAIFGGATLWAHSVAANASSRVDWELLESLDVAFASHDVVIVEEPQFERLFWMRAELVGVDPRWPALSYVARQYDAGSPVQWPAAPWGRLNLTGKGVAAPKGRVILVPRTFDFSRVPANAVVVNANPPGIHPWVPQPLTIVETYDHRLETPAARALERFRTNALRFNRRFRYEWDLGDSGFPGHFWIVMHADR
jgi:hypothetical protein